jgi:hypothetical protein
MNYEGMFKIVKDLKFDIEKHICDDGNTITYIFRPSKLSKRFQNYDLKKNFQIWIKEGERSFRPNHLRIMIDLNLRTRCRPDLKRKMLQVFDNIFYGKDPNEEIKIIENEKFEHYLNSIKTIANLHQLFIIEQDYCYNKESKFDPPTLFYQGWVRQMIDSPKEIDNMCMSVCSRQPPQTKYTNKENKKHDKFEENLKQLWYLD